MNVFERLKERLFGQGKPIRILLRDSTVTFFDGTEAHQIAIASISRVVAFARDDLTYDTLALEITADEQTLLVDEDARGFLDFVIALGDKLGFGSDTWINRCLNRQLGEPFSQWRDVLFER